jgi:hypothetical protein
MTHTSDEFLQLVNAPGPTVNGRTRLAGLLPKHVVVQMNRTLAKLF